jgi:NAD(P)H-nitrite reductase large subunit
MRILIVGAGPAGLTVAETLREHDTRSEITMLSSEPFPPYAPPAMADYFLTGREETLFWKGKNVCDELGVTYRMGVRVAAVAPEEHAVTLEAGERLSYDRLVLASGSRLYAPIEGWDLPGVYNFKSLAAAIPLVERAKQRKVTTALIVGGGFIGVEVALLLADLGLEVTLLEMEDRVMPRMLDGEVSSIVVSALEARGVDVRLETRANRFTGKRKATGVELSSNERLKADVYIAATGIKPNVDFLRGSGLDVGWGVRVDDTLRTSDVDIFAAGDVAETSDRLTGERYVHAIFPNATAQGRAVAWNLLGFEALYEGSETMNSLKHLGVPVMAVGRMRGKEIRYRRGNALRKVYVEDGALAGFRLAGDIRGAGHLHSLMLKQMDVTAFEDRLADPRFGPGQAALHATLQRLS